MLILGGLLAGLVMLLGGGTLLVRGASDIATRLGVPPLIVGLTVVGFGTSSPELFVNVVGALSGETGIAFGNVVGSNITNLALVLGAAAFIKPITIDSQLVRREIPLLLLATSAISIMALDGPLEGLPAIISRSEAVVLLLLFCIFIYISALDIVQARRSDQLVVDIEKHALSGGDLDARIDWVFVVLGMGLLFVGGEMTVHNGVEIAAKLGVSSTIIGLFVVALGTSMPELVTTIVAAVRGESALAIGNVVGSNIFNCLIVLPASGVISQIPVPGGGVADLLVSWSLAALLIPVFFLGEARLSRFMGGFLLVAYAGYVTARIFYDTM